MSNRFKGGNNYRDRMQQVVAEITGESPSSGWHAQKDFPLILIRASRRGIELYKLSPEEKEELPF